MSANIFQIWSTNWAGLHEESNKPGEFSQTEEKKYFEPIIIVNNKFTEAIIAIDW